LDQELHLTFPGTYVIRAGGNGSIGGFKINLTLKPLLLPSSLARKLKAILLSVMIIKIGSLLAKREI